VTYADGSSGSWLESLNSEYAHPYIILTDTRAYSSTARQFCRVAAERRIATALVTDIWCPWARDYPVDLLQVKTDTGHFWDSLAPISCLFNLLLSAVVEQLGPTLSRRLAVNRRCNKNLVNSNVNKRLLVRLQDRKQQMNQQVIWSISARAFRRWLSISTPAPTTLPASPSIRSPLPAAPDAAAALERSMRIAQLAGLNLVVLDAYRPQQAQQLLWNACPNQDYVVPIALGSNHSRGTAIDVTLMDENGQPLDMGTAFDEMDDLTLITRRFPRPPSVTACC
jgi:hypothetical protein